MNSSLWREKPYPASAESLTVGAGDEPPKRRSITSRTRLKMSSEGERNGDSQNPRVGRESRIYKAERWWKSLRAARAGVNSFHRDRRIGTMAEERMRKMSTRRERLGRCLALVEKVESGKGRAEQLFQDRRAGTGRRRE